MYDNVFLFRVSCANRSLPYGLALSLAYKLSVLRPLSSTLAPPLAHKLCVLCAG